MSIIFLFIEGNIGAGKTRFLKLFEKFLMPKYHTYVVPEFIFEDEANTLLNALYDKRLYHMEFQRYLYKTRVDWILNLPIKKNEGGFVLFDRGVNIQYDVFCKVLRDYKKITDKEFGIVDEWMKEYKDHLSHKFPLHQEKIVYLDCSIGECMERISMRKRKGEEKITPDYLLNLERVYFDYLKNKKDVCILDANKHWIGQKEIDYVMTNLICKPSQ